MGTGCVFNRTALYGYEPPIKPKHKKAGFLSSCFGGSRKKGSNSSKKGSDKKKSSKNVDPTVPIFNLEDIEEGVEGIVQITKSFHFMLSLSKYFTNPRMTTLMLYTTPYSATPFSKLIGKAVASSGEKKGKIASC